jgi:hypothetical protein
MSAYYGGSFYNIILWWGNLTSLRMGFSLTIVVAATFSVFLLMREKMGFWTRLGIQIWPLLLVINFAVPIYATEIGFIAFSCLLISLLAYAGQKQDVLLSKLELDRKLVY